MLVDVYFCPVRIDLGIMVEEIALHVHPGVDKRDMGYTVVPIGPYEQGG